MLAASSECLQELQKIKDADLDPISTLQAQIGVALKEYKRSTGKDFGEAEALISALLLSKREL